MYNKNLQLISQTITNVCPMLVYGCRSDVQSINNSSNYGIITIVKYLSLVLKL